MSREAAEEVEAMLVSPWELLQAHLRGDCPACSRVVGLRDHVGIVMEVLDRACLVCPEARRRTDTWLSSTFVFTTDTLKLK